MAGGSHCGWCITAPKGPPLAFRLQGDHLGQHQRESMAEMRRILPPSGLVPALTTQPYCPPCPSGFTRLLPTSSSPLSESGSESRGSIPQLHLLQAALPKL
ncbi:pulmonary surfactant-associated protein B-like [Platysternon megacephalum]|uniref:Pulmonary surfactant-associated protein B-like n=1 Tax=Platysternon megacephalum TaxID=55544 RepID=A0A4D9DTB1_9SAUR|nr:pulmonary surfactant-associated protein B-like [Platysternon megacephalum]